MLPALSPASKSVLVQQQQDFDMDQRARDWVTHKRAEEERALHYTADAEARRTAGGSWKTYHAEKEAELRLREQRSKRAMYRPAPTAAERQQAAMVQQAQAERKALTTARALKDREAASRAAAENETVDELDLEAEKAATRIQSQFRGFKARKEVQVLAEEHEQQVQAATHIQSVFRGHATRKQMTEGGTGISINGAPVGSLSTAGNQLNFASMRPLPIHNRDHALVEIRDADRLRCFPTFDSLLDALTAGFPGQRILGLSYSTHGAPTEFVFQLGRQLFEGLHELRHVEREVGENRARREVEEAQRRAEEARKQAELERQKAERAAKKAAQRAARRKQTADDEEEEEEPQEEEEEEEEEEATPKRLTRKEREQQKQEKQQEKERTKNEAALERKLVLLQHRLQKFLQLHSIRVEFE